jgi:hypothetical protein
MAKASLKELMGSAGSSAKQRELSLSDLGDLLGEKLPELEFHPVGRLRLITALRNRFGDNYRNIPGVKNIMSQFDDEAKFNVKLQQLKQLKAKRSK